MMNRSSELFFSKTFFSIKSNFSLLNTQKGFFIHFLYIFEHLTIYLMIMIFSEILQFYIIPVEIIKYKHRVLFKLRVKMSSILESPEKLLILWYRFALYSPRAVHVQCIACYS